MCFKISYQQRPWTRKTVYKIVQLRESLTGAPPEMQGPHYSTGTPYQFGVTQQTYVSIFGNQSRGGLYVYKDLATARAAKRKLYPSPDHKIIRCRVRPEDFGYHNKRVYGMRRFLPTATYRAITPLAFVTRSMSR